MKKFLFFALAAAFAFTSCNNDETIATAQKGAIAFAPAADNATRSVYDPSITTANITDFAVYGFMNDVTGVVFNDELVTGSNTSGWSYQNTQYWTPNQYYFAALAPSNNRAWKLTQVKDENAAYYGVGSVEFENDGKQDLLYWAGTADGTDENVQSNPVSIVFNHLLSKVKFSFVNNMDNANAKLIVKDITITNAKIKGNINLAVENWWDGDDWKLEADTMPFKFGNAAVASETAAEQIAQYAEIESYNEMLLFPENNAEYHVTFIVELWMDAVLAATYNHTSAVTTTLEMGKAYDFKAIINAENVTGSTEDQLKPIEFTVTVEDWEEAGQVILPEYKPVVVEDEAQFRAALEVGGDILLANDITTTTHFVIPEGANVTLNLNGKTLKGGVEYTGTQTGAEISAITVDGGNLTIEGLGNIQGAVYGVYAKNKGTLTIKGGNFTAETSAVQVGEATVEINGGNFSVTDADKRYVINCLDANYTDGTAKVAIKGGKFTDFNPADNAAEGAGTNFVAEGYESVAVDTNVWEVRAK